MIVLIIHEDGSAVQVGALTLETKAAIADGILDAFFFDGTQFNEWFGDEWVGVKIESEATHD